MSTDNRTLLQKADMLLAELAAGGLLQPAQADQFIRLAIKQPVLLKEVFVTPMATPVERRDTMRFANRVLKPGTEATALALAQRSVPTLGWVELVTKLYRAETRISDEVLEDQIERGQFKNTILQELSGAIARDMEWVGINGDTASADALLATQDGWLKRCNTNLVDATAGGLPTELARTTLRDLIDTLPVEYRNLPALRYYTNYHAQLMYADSITTRATALGDAMLSMAANTEFGYSKVPVRPVPEFPDALGVGANETVVLAVNPKNLVMGVQRQIRLEQQRDVPAGVTILVVSLRFALAVLVPASAAKATGVVGQ